MQKGKLTQALKAWWTKQKDAVELFWYKRQTAKHNKKRQRHTFRNH